MFPFLITKSNLFYLFRHPKEEKNIKIIKISSANQGFYLKGLLMCNWQTILQYWQFFDYGDLDHLHLSFLLTQQL